MQLRPIPRRRRVTACECQYRSASWETGIGERYHAPRRDRRDLVRARLGPLSRSPQTVARSLAPPDTDTLASPTDNAERKLYGKLRTGAASCRINNSRGASSGPRRPLSCSTSPGHRQLLSSAGWKLNPPRDGQRDAVGRNTGHRRRSDVTRAVRDARSHRDAGGNTRNCRC